MGYDFNVARRRTQTTESLITEVIGAEVFDDLAAALYSAPETADFTLDVRATRDAVADEVRFLEPRSGQFVFPPFSAELLFPSPIEYDPSTVRALRKEVEALRARVATLEADVGIPQGETIDEPSFDEALARARVFFDEHRGERVLPTTLAERIGVSVMTAIDLCEALEAEGILVEAD